MQVSDSKVVKSKPIIAILRLIKEGKMHFIDEGHSGKDARSLLSHDDRILKEFSIGGMSAFRKKNRNTIMINLSNL